MWDFNNFLYIEIGTASKNLECGKHLEDKDKDTKQRVVSAERGIYIEMYNGERTESRKVRERNNHHISHPGAIVQGLWKA